MMTKPPPVYSGVEHYDSGLEGPNIHFDLLYDSGAGPHTLRSITVVRDVGSPYDRITIRHPDGTEWISPVIPEGTRSFTKNQINNQGFTLLEDCTNFTAQLSTS